MPTDPEVSVTDEKNVWSDADRLESCTSPFALVTRIQLEYLAAGSNARKRYDATPRSPSASGPRNVLSWPVALSARRSRGAAL